MSTVGKKRVLTGGNVM